LHKNTNILFRYSFKEIKNRLIEHNLKATQQRIVIYEALLKLSNHPRAEDIYDHIKVNNPSISLATIYKSLDTFVTTGLASKVLTGEGYFRYDANMNIHNHIYCLNTKEIIDHEDEELKDLIEGFFQKKEIKNLRISDIRLHISGEKIDPENNISID
jgi:Fur family transcriptional regulator, peroxide stress response regulator